MWPYHPKPREGEIFSSWLSRTAFGNAGKLHSFCHRNWPGRQIWTRDIDVFVGDDLLSDLADGTCTRLDAARTTCLQSIEGTLVEKIHGRSNTRWILPIGIHHRTRSLPGQQYCPTCIAADEVPYFRLNWRLSYLTVCPIHGCLLLDRCNRCSAPLITYNEDKRLCAKCGSNLAEGVLRPASSGWVSALQFAMEGWRSHVRHSYILSDVPDPLLCFNITHQVLAVLNSGERSEALRVETARFGRIKHQSIRQVTSFENLEVEERHYLMQLAGILLHEWPFTFVGLASEARVWWTWALKDRNPKTTAYTFANVTESYLTPR